MSEISDRDPKPYKLGSGYRESNGFWRAYEGKRLYHPKDEGSVCIICPKCGGCVVLGRKPGATGYCNRKFRNPKSGNHELLLCGTHFKVGEYINSDREFNIMYSSPED